jgi:hypothetical protein
MQLSVGGQGHACFPSFHVFCQGISMDKTEQLLRMLSHKYFELL